MTVALKLTLLPPVLLLTRANVVCPTPTPLAKSLCGQDMMGFTLSKGCASHFFNHPCGFRFTTLDIYHPPIRCATVSGFTFQIIARFLPEDSEKIAVRSKYYCLNLTRKIYHPSLGPYCISWPRRVKHNAPMKELADASVLVLQANKTRATGYVQLVQGAAPELYLTLQVR